MKSNLLRTFFEWALITSVLMSAGFFVWFYMASRDVRVCGANIVAAQNRFQNNHTVIGYLLEECQLYAKTNAEMARVLESLRVKPATSNVPTGAPAAAPKTGGK